MRRDVLERLADAVPAVFALNGFGPRICILAARVSLWVLRESGVHATASAVQLAAMNAAYRRLVIEHGDDPPESARRQCERDGGWSVAIGLGHPGGEQPGYNGHVVLIVEDRILFDPSLGQVCRPDKNLIVDPIGLYPLNRERWGASRAIGYTNAHDTTIVYQRISDRSFVAAPDWTKVRRDDQLVRDVQAHVFGAAA